MVRLKSAATLAECITPVIRFPRIFINENPGVSVCLSVRWDASAE